MRVGIQTMASPDARFNVWHMPRYPNQCRVSGPSAILVHALR
jgi:hypothetical protein